MGSLYGDGLHGRRVGAANAEVSRLLSHGQLSPVLRPGEHVLRSPGRDLTERPAVSTDLRAEIIKAQGVTKRFGALVAVDRVDYSLREHEVAGIIGSNR